MIERSLPLLALACLAAACTAEEQQTPASLASEGTPVPAVAAPSQVGATPGEARKVEQSNDLYEFDYSYPAAAGAIPDLRAMLDADISKERAALVERAKQQKAERQDGDFPYNPLGKWVAWKVVTDLPAWLSMSAEISAYEGGAHPNHWFDSMVWDRRANERREPVELFVSEEALSRAIRQPFCAALNKQRAERRGEPVPAGSSDEFDACIDPVESTVILGSSNGKAFDRIGVLVPPYAAGPYAEGDYEVTLPVTQAVMAAVKPEYRSSFVSRR